MAAFNGKNEMFHISIAEPALNQILSINPEGKQRVLRSVPPYKEEISNMEQSTLPNTQQTTSVKTDTYITESFRKMVRQFVQEKAVENLHLLLDSSAYVTMVIYHHSIINSGRIPKMMITISSAGS